MNEEYDQNLSRFLKVSAFFCAFCVCYMLLIGTTQKSALFVAPTYDTATSEDIYREFGQGLEMIEPAGGEPVRQHFVIWETYGHVNMPPPPNNALADIAKIYIGS